MNYSPVTYFLTVCFVSCLLCLLAACSGPADLHLAEPTVPAGVLEPLPTNTAVLPTNVPTEQACLYAAPVSVKNDSQPQRVLYIKQGNIWLWTGDPPTIYPLTYLGHIGVMRLSPDQRFIAFTRTEQTIPYRDELWVLDLVDGALQMILDEEDLLQLHSDSNPTDVGLVQFDWLPDEHQLLFTTREVVHLLHDYYYRPYEDLHLIDVVTGEQQTVFPTGHGGKFSFSPDSKQLAIVSTNGRVTMVDWKNKSYQDHFLPHDPWFAGPGASVPELYWAMDSQAVYSTLSTDIDDDGLGLDTLLAVWYIPANQSDESVKAHLVRQVTGFFPTTELSPNRQFLLVSSFDHLTIFDLASDQVVVSIEDATVINFGSWSPDSSQFVYVTPRVNSPQQQFYVSNLCQVHVPIPSPLRWANSNWYFYQLRQRDESGDIFREHRLTSLSGGKDLLLDTTTGSLTHIIVLEQ